MKTLVTGGAGFIGSHLVDALISRGDEVSVLDDLSTGSTENLNPAATFVEGSITDLEAVRHAVAGTSVVFHQGALGSVQRSVENPLQCDAVNVHGTLAVLKAAFDAGVSRVVYASSSSVYGGAIKLPTPETAPLMPRSPYAVTKLTGEHYLRVFTELFGLETVALRYFNIFGPRQRRDSAYAAVIPLFVDALLSGRPPTVHGDGKQSRDLTYVANAVAANLSAAAAPAAACSGRAYNVAAGGRYSLLDLLGSLGEIIGVVPQPVFGSARPGDIRDSQADISAARQDLGYQPVVQFEDGLRQTVSWFRVHNESTRGEPPCLAA